MMRRALLVTALLVLCSAPAHAAKVSLSAEVAAHSWKTLRLRGLTKDASLAMRVESSGPIAVMLVHEAEVAKLPNPMRPAFAGSLERRLAFRVTLPAAGTYYVFLDNRQGNEGRTVNILMEALRAPSQKPPAKRPDARPDGGKLQPIGYHRGLTP